MEDEPVNFSWTIEWSAIQAAICLISIAVLVLVVIGASILDNYLAQSAIGDCIAVMEKNK